MLGHFQRLFGGQKGLNLLQTNVKDLRVLLFSSQGSQWKVILLEPLECQAQIANFVFKDKQLKLVFVFNFLQLLSCSFAYC